MRGGGIRTAAIVLADTCRTLADSAVATAGSALQVVAVLVVCRTRPCTAETGEATYTLPFEDGSTEEGVYGWNAPFR